MVLRLYRILKYALWGLLLVVVAGGALVWFQRDALVRRYKPAIEAELSQHLRAQVRLSDLEIDLFPSLGVVAQGVSIVPFGGCSGVTAARGEFRIELPALVAGRYVITSLAFSGIRAEVSVVDGSVSLPAESGAACVAQGTEPPQPSLQEPPEPSTSTGTSEGPATFSLELEDFAVRDAEFVVLTPQRHTVLISELIGAAAISDGVLSLENSKLRADFDGLHVDLAAGSIRADFVQTMLDLRGGDVSVNGERISLSGRYGPGAQLSDGRVSATSLSLSKLVAAAHKVGIDLSVIRSGDVSVSSEVSYSKSRGFSVRTSDLQAKKIDVEHSGSTYQASLVRGPVECVATAEATACTSDVAFEGFHFATKGVDVSNVNARLEKLKATIPSRGDLRVAGTLTGSSLKLESPAVHINSISSVSAPLEVSVTERGGYSIAGVVTGRGIEVQAADRELSQVGGEVKLSLSSAQDSFSTPKLSTNIMGQPVTIAGQFVISPASYSFRNIQSEMAGGAVTLTGDVRRTAGQPFSAQIAVTNAVASTLTTVILARRENPFEGQIRSMNLSLTGSLESPLSSLKGAGDFKLMAAHVRGFDLTRALADALSSIPIANLTLARDKLSDDGFDKVGEASFTISDEKLHFSAFTFYRRQYTLNATGTYSFSKVVDLKGAVTFMKQTLTSLGGGFDRLGALLGRVGKVEIPVFIRGQVPEISVVPDVVTLMKDNSGLTLAGEVLGTTLSAGRSVAGFVLSPFESKRDKEGSSEADPTKR